MADVIRNLIIKYVYISSGHVFVVGEAFENLFELVFQVVLDFVALVEHYPFKLAEISGG